MRIAGGMTIAWLSLFLAHASHALGTIEFGPEFTLSDVKYGSSDKFYNVHTRMQKHLVEDQPEGAKFEVVSEGGPHTFTSPNGWWFSWHQEGGDEWHGASMEVRMKQGTVDYFRHFKNDMQDAIFVSAANEDIIPALFRGGGHINISASAFDSDLLLRNFVVDLINHDELFLGVFGYDTNNALSFQLLPPRAQLAVYEVIQKFEQGIVEGVANPDEQGAFLHQLQQAMQFAMDDFIFRWGLIEQRGKYFAFNFSKFTSNKRMELRAVRPQASMDMWVRQIDLLAHRLAYLDKIKRPIPILWKVPVKPLSFSVAGENHMLNPPIEPQLAMRAFYEYVTESGLKWQDHRDYLWPQWTWNIDGRPSELEKFEKSQWFTRREKVARCQQELEVAG